MINLDQGLVTACFCSPAVRTCGTCGKSETLLCGYSQHHPAEEVAGEEDTILNAGPIFTCETLLYWKKMASVASQISALLQDG